MTFTVNVTMDDEQAVKVGEEIIDLFDLKHIGKSDRYRTTWGNKTAMGLGYSINRIMEKHK